MLIPSHPRASWDNRASPPRTRTGSSALGICLGPGRRALRKDAGSGLGLLSSLTRQKTNARRQSVISSFVFCLSLGDRRRKKTMSTERQPQSGGLMASLSACLTKSKARGDGALWVVAKSLDTRGSENAIELRQPGAGEGGYVIRSAEIESPAVSAPSNLTIFSESLGVTLVRECQEGGGKRT